MDTYFLFGTYTQKALDGIDAKRTKLAEGIIQGFGGSLRSVYALLGQHDIVMIVELPGLPEALQVSLALSKETGIAFSSVPAIPVAEFDRLASGVMAGTPLDID